MNTREKGRLGEDIAAEYLIKEDFKILDRNYQIRTGEVDIIALDDECLVFIEVKSWDAMGAEALEYSIDRRKQRKIIVVSREYIEKHRRLKFNRVRYDVIFIGDRGGIVDHYRNAFTETGEL